MPNTYERQVMHSGGEQLQGVQPDNRARQMLDAQGAKLQAKAKKIYAQEVRNTMAREMNDAAAKYGDDPAALGKAFEGIRNGTMSQIADPDVLADFATNFDLKSSSMLATSKIAFTRKQRAEHKSALNDSLADNLDDLTQNAIGMFESDDDDIKVGYMHAKAGATNALKAVGDNGLNIFTDSERNRGTKQISRGALVGLQTFLADPTGDPVRKAEIINRFNNGQYKEMFSAEDWPKALRLIKAAGKQYGSDGSGTSATDPDTLTGDILKIELDDFKEKKDSGYYDKASLSDMLNFRTKVADAMERGQISQKQAKDIMQKSAPGMLQKINAFIDDDGNGGGWFSRPKPSYIGLKALRGLIEQHGVMSSDQQLFLYEDFMRRWVAEGGTDDKRDDEAQTTARKIAQDVGISFANRLYPGFDAKTSSAIVMGRGVWNFGATPTTVNGSTYKIIEIDDEDDKQ